MALEQEVIGGANYLQWEVLSNEDNDVCIIVPDESPAPLAVDHLAAAPSSSPSPTNTNDSSTKPMPPLESSKSFRTSLKTNAIKQAAQSQRKVSTTASVLLSSKHSSPSPAAVNNADDWITFFQSIVPPSSSSSKRNVLSALIPDTVLLSESGVPGVWYYNSSGPGTIRNREVKVKSASSTVPRNIFESWTKNHHKQPSSSINNPVAIARYGFTSRLLSLEEFKDLCDCMEHNAHLKEEDLEFPFCIQQYIKPEFDTRYITTYTQTELHTMCETFLMSFTDRYNTTSNTSNLPKSHHVSVVKNKDVFEKKNTDKSLITRVQHETIRIVNYINSNPSISYDNQLVGLVLEFIVPSSQNNSIILNSVIGMAWKGETPSWEVLSRHDPESNMIASYLQKKNTTTKTTTVPKKKDNIKEKFKNSPVPKIFRDGKFVPLSNNSNSSSHRLHNGSNTERGCRPALAVALAKELEFYKNSVSQHNGARMEATATAKAATDELKRSVAQIMSLQERIDRQSTDYESKLQALQSENARLTRENENQSSTISQQKHDIESLERELEKTKETLVAERDTTFGILHTLNKSIQNNHHQ